MNSTFAKPEMINDSIIENQPKSKNGSFIHVTQGAKNYLLAAHEITYIQADHIYVRIFTKDGKQFLQRASLGSLLKILPNEQFVQTHRSFIVNTIYIDEWNAQTVTIQDEVIPISRSRKKLFTRKINQCCKRKPNES